MLVTSYVLVLIFFSLFISGAYVFSFALFNLIMGINAVRINLVFVSIFFTVCLGSVLIASGFFRMQYDAFEAIRLLKAGGYIFIITDVVSRRCVQKDDCG